MADKYSAKNFMNPDGTFDVHRAVGALDDEKFKRFVDEHENIPGIGYVQGEKGKITRTIENPADRPPEPMSHKDAATAMQLLGIGARENKLLTPAEEAQTIRVARAKAEMPDKILNREVGRIDNYISRNTARINAFVQQMKEAEKSEGNEKTINRLQTQINNFTAANEQAGNTKAQLLNEEITPGEVNWGGVGAKTKPTNDAGGIGKGTPQKTEVPPGAQTGAYKGTRGYTVDGKTFYDMNGKRLN